MSVLDRLLEAVAGEATVSREEFVDLLEAHAPELYRRVYVLLGRAEFVEDVAQQTMVEALASWRRYDRSRPIGPWITGIALNVARRYWRRARHARRVAGTRFAVAADAGIGTRVAALDGHVVVRRGDREIDVYGGTQLDAGAPAPVPLDAAWRLSLEELLPRSTRPAAGTVERRAAARGEERAVGERPAEVPSSSSLPAAKGEEGAVAEGRAEGASGGEVAGVEAAGGGASGVDLAERWYREAERALGRGDFDRAIDLFRRVADAAPGSPRAGHALIDLGRAAQRAGRLAEAERAYERYLAQHPRGTLREDAWVAWCRLRARGGPPERVRACYSGYLAEFPAGAFAAEAREAVERVGVGEP